MSKHVRRTETVLHTSLGWGAEVIVPRRRQRPPPRNGLATAKEAFVSSLLSNMAESEGIESPYLHWFLQRCLPDDGVDQILALPFPAPRLDGVSGRRELHNATRTYFDADNRARFPVCEVFCQAFQDKRVTDCIAHSFGATLDGTCLRVEFAQDTDGFWLEPHTDLGVKVFTLLLYLSKVPSHADLGTDIYDEEKKHIGRLSFAPNAAMVFVPSDTTYHGFEPRPIEGVRKSVIVNYVTADWRAREQLAFPDQPIG
jgi:hypothetical protein